MALTCHIEATDRDHQIEVGAVETAAGQSSQSEQEGQQEEDVDSRGEGAAAAGPLCEDPDHVGVGWAPGVITLLCRAAAGPHCAPLWSV